MFAAVAPSTAPLRGTAVGAASAALAIAAHGMGGGELPQSSSLTLLIAVCATVGAVTATLPALMRGPAALIVALGLGQGAAHVTMTLSEHAHSPAPGLLMLAAHAGATAACAVLVLAAERLFGVVTRVLRAVLASLAPVAADTSASTVSTGFHRGPVDALLRASISRRGPPLSV